MTLLRVCCAAFGAVGFLVAVLGASWLFSPLIGGGDGHSAPESAIVFASGGSLFCLGTLVELLNKHLGKR